MSLGNLSVNFVKFYNKLLSCWQDHLWNFGKAIYGTSCISSTFFFGKSFVSVDNVHVPTYCFTLLLTLVKKKEYLTVPQIYKFDSENILS